MEAVLPLRCLTSAVRLALVAWVQKRNHQVYCSYRKGRQAMQRGVLGVALGQSRR
ncbi:MAG: hypothetical protein ETSY1_05645 [Candidatus Entotheonella factor]|uniref:Uncharacterized protein n=1 Tax=Entotheonella factor TaxID=1429438 RepID=W4LWY9_ENTF1|nr:MAG: hypothetical protein ETSY1_05645 [Candidatus Entotheonella factor]